MVQIVHATLQRESNCWLLFVGSTDSTLARNIIRGPSLNLLIKDVLPKKSLRDLAFINAFFFFSYKNTDRLKFELHILSSGELSFLLLKFNF